MKDYDSKRIRIIEKLAKNICNYEQPITIMEVCGTHTMSIWRYGIKSLLPQNIRLISGPGCPVCVTDSSILGAALAVADLPDVILTAFGDMLRVPAGGSSLQKGRDFGADIRIVLSPLDAFNIAKENPKKQVVFFAVGFETTAPLSAAVVDIAATQGVKNFSVICAHKTMPCALTALLTQADNIDGLLCPGHVAAVTGSKVFDFIPHELGKPAAIAGFEPDEILTAILAIVQNAGDKEKFLYNCYPKVVKAEGNTHALAIMRKIFMPKDDIWRGLGIISGSGLALKQEYREFDALIRFAADIAGHTEVADSPRCRCGAVLRGELMPFDCPLFSCVCSPSSPEGACMVSSEGACAAAYKYTERKAKFDA